MININLGTRFSEETGKVPRNVTPPKISLTDIDKSDINEVSYLNYIVNFRKHFGLMDTCFN